MNVLVIAEIIIELVLIGFKIAGIQRLREEAGENYSIFAEYERLPEGVKRQ
jgi:hypothetical protein